MLIVLHEGGQELLLLHGELCQAGGGGFGTESSAFGLRSFAVGLMLGSLPLGPTPNRLNPDGQPIAPPTVTRRPQRQAAMP